MATLAELARRYLAQPLPDISGIFQPREDAPVEETPVEETVPGVTRQLLQQTGGGGDNFSVYNPDPTRTRTSDQYSPYAYRQAAERNLIGDFYSSGTEAQKLMDTYPEYYEGPQLTGIPGLIAAYAKNSLPGRIIGGVANIANDILPINRRAIIENEALGAGFMLNDIGQIVSDGGSAYDPSGLNIMAGYNLAQVDQSTFDKRRERAKKNMTPEGYEKFNKALTAAEEKILGPKGIKTKADLVFDDISLQKDPTYKTLDEAIAAGLAEGDDDDDDFNIEDFIAATNPNAIPPGIMGTTDFGYLGIPNRGDIIQDIGIQSIKDNIERGRERERQRQIEIEKMAKKKRDIQQYTGGGGGDNNSGGGGGNIGPDGADYSSAAETGAKAGFSYGL